MGEHQVSRANEQTARTFTQAILADIQALELMIARGMIETGRRRVGAEQEMNIVDSRGFVAPLAHIVSKNLSDSRFQNELALFNLEANLEPRSLTGTFLSEIETDLHEVIAIARDAVQTAGGEILLTGIVPTLRREDLTAANMTPEVRYQCLNEASLEAQRGGIRLAIDGLEQLDSEFDSVVVEGANTSLQLHLQVAPDDAARLYNLAQLITAPVLAAACNSPVLLGKCLWHETRIAVFERALDDRSASQLTREMPTRVGFGSSWLEESLVELFRDNVARYRVIMTRPSPEDAVAAVERGIAPDLGALTLHNGTVWRWNRPCYGVAGGIPHLRIENRVLPGGPTVLDEVANAALFYGLMLGLDGAYGDIRKRISFADAKANFLAAAVLGLQCEFEWLDGHRVGAQNLLVHELLPAARSGLESVNVPSEEIARYLGVIEARVSSGRTGAQWLLDAVAGVPTEERQEQCAAAVRTMLDRQHSNTPVHAWEAIETKRAKHASSPRTLAEIMTRDVFTVSPTDVIDLATSVMDWKHIRHVPVEDRDGRVVGLLTARDLINLEPQHGDGAASVEALMNTSPPTASPDLSILEGMRQLTSSDSGCLLIVQDGALVGIVTERDLLMATLADSGSSGDD